MRMRIGKEGFSRGLFLIIFLYEILLTRITLRSMHIHQGEGEETTTRNLGKKDCGGGSSNSRR